MSIGIHTPKQEPRVILETLTRMKARGLEAYWYDEDGKPMVLRITDGSGDYADIPEDIAIEFAEGLVAVAKSNKNAEKVRIEFLVGS